MPYTVVLPFNTDQVADDTLEEIQQVMDALNGTRGVVSEIVRVGGKLQQVRLSLPDGAVAAQTSVDKISDNPGVVTTCLNLPIPTAQLGKLLNLSGPFGMVYSGTLPVNGTQFRIRQTDACHEGPVQHATLVGPANTYDRKNTNTNFNYLLSLRSSSDSAWTFASSETLTLNFDDGSTPLVIAPLADIVIAQNSIGARTYYLDATGRMYLRIVSGSGQPALTYDFSTSCLGPV